MKILAIRGRNLASLAGDFEVDFTKEPLSSAGIFAITGCTGAGKSTLLDAMCIALYATSPRTNKVSYNNDITDTQQYTIKEQDCRNILRKGTANGYAEVDFKALDGKVYRANWSVRRARNNSFGKMQGAECSLFNLTDGTQIDGSKSEILARIPELIGLTYEQFTRAVLLAQGDFATFLKATPKEKAEILEKLTGTDIYSKISARIYSRYKEAGNEIKLLGEKMKDVVLLTDEEQKELVDEKNIFDKELQAAEQQGRLLENKKAWIEQHNLLIESLNKANEEHRLAKEGVAASKEIAERLALTDSVQGIRDTYMSAIEMHNSKALYRKQLEQDNAECAKLNGMLDDAQKQLADSIGEQERLNNEWLKIQPCINEARDIEADCRNIERNLEELKAERGKIESSLENYRKEATLLAGNIANNEKELKAIEEWFDRYRVYSTIIPKSDIVVANIKDIAQTGKSISARIKLLEETIQLLSNEEKRLKEKEREAEELDKVLPEEIISLRKRLVDGEPCPVCGSLHHQISDVEEKTLKEEALIKAKEEVAASMENIRRSIEENKNSINSHKAYIESLEESLKNSRERNREILLPLEGEVATFDEAFAEGLQKTAQEWNNRLKKQTDITAAQEVNKAKADTAKERVKELSTNEEERAKAIVERNCELQKKRERVKALIGEGKRAEDIENSFNAKIMGINGIVTTAMEKRNNIMAAREKLTGRIAQAEKVINDIEERLKGAKQEVDRFLEEREDCLNMEQLHRLLTTDSEEIARLRNTIENLRNRLLKAETTCKERQNSLEEHLKAPHIPDNGESIADIESALAAIATQRKNLLDKISDANSKLKQDEENKKKYEHYCKEFEEKKEIFDNWTILNEAFGSAEGDKFKIIAQEYTLDILLEYANKHLDYISQRYKLARIVTDSLAIKVIDADIMNEERSINSLSGGETFLVSLALALALSSLSSNRMSIESLFIDEGFGALDNETLRVAMEALERLQGEGRKVGVISHLQEILERIPAKIRIEKEREGCSKVKVELS